MTIEGYPSNWRLIQKFVAQDAALGRLAVHLKVITQAQLTECLAEQELDQQMSVGDFCVKKGYITGDQLKALLAKQKALAQPKPTHELKPHAVAPTRTVSVTPTTNAVTPSALPGEEFTRQPTLTRTSKPHTAQTKPHPAPTPAPTPTKRTVQPNLASLGSADEPKIHRLLRAAMIMGASDLHLSSERQPLCYIHGQLEPIQGAVHYDGDVLEAMLREIVPKGHEFPAKEQASIDFMYAINSVGRFRAHYFHEHRGVSAFFRCIAPEIPTPAEIGLPPWILPLCDLSKGLIVVTGRFGNGRSTTMRVLLEHINAMKSKHIVTIEPMIEFTHRDKRAIITQREVGQRVAEYEHALYELPRENPEIVMLHDLNDPSILRRALVLADGGCLVFGTLNSDTVPETIQRLIDAFPAEQEKWIRALLASSLKGIVAQTLCRRRGGGRIAAFEILATTLQVADFIRDASKTDQIHLLLHSDRKDRQAMQSLNDHLFELVQKKLVEANEACRIATHSRELKNLFRQNGIAFDEDDPTLGGGIGTQWRSAPVGWPQG